MGVSGQSLQQYRQFYPAYPPIWQTPSAKFNLTSSEQASSLREAFSESNFVFE